MVHFSDKVTIAQEEIYLTYGMVLCLPTLTDLYTRCAGLSASAELIVLLFMSTIFLILIAINSIP